MKLIDKLKNALFEEEYVEVEEKPKKKEIKREKRGKEEITKKEKPIAKKIIQPERKEKVKEIIEEEPELLDDDFEVKKSPEKSLKNEFKFPVMEDKDFKMEEQPKKEEKLEQEIPITKKKKNKELKTSRIKKSKPYGLDEFELPENEHGLYEKRDERTYFKPSPIISPIYGILDKNYKKEEIRDKKEIRLTSSYAHENLDVDEVRKRAYGNLADDLEEEFKDTSSKVNIVEYDDLEEDDDDIALLDLSEDHDTPEVKKVTVGDALEYFEDLGLEYNVDYKDTSKEKATGRRVKKDQELEDFPETPKVIKREEKPEEDIDIQEDSQEDEDDDNLFDLIDSMYDKD